MGKVAHRIFGEKILLPLSDGSYELTSALLDIEGGRFTKITRCERTEIPSDKPIEDLGTALITPAFVNSHTHLCMIAFRGIGGLASLEGNVVEDLYFKLEAKMTADDIAAFTRVASLEALMNGTGFVWDHYYHGFAIAKTLAEVGLCGAIAPTLQDLSGPGVDHLDAAWESTFRIAESQYLRERGVVAALGPHATDTVSDELWRRVKEAANTWELPIHCHIAQSIEEVERSWEKHECSPMTRMQRLGICDLKTARLWVHGLWVSEKELDGLTEKDALVHCPSAQMQFDFPAPTRPWRERKLPVLLGTDAASCNDSINLQAELRLFAAGQSYHISESTTHKRFRQSGSLEAAQQVREMRQKLWSQNAPFTVPERLLDTVWKNTNKLHNQANVGLIAEGALANICVWNPDHPALWPNDSILHTLCYSNTSPALNRIMTCGQWRIDGAGDLNGRIMRDPRTMVWLQEAQQRRTELLERAGVVN